jgi:regulator of RNase E activity RraB
MNASWDSYVCRVNDEFASIFLDLDAIDPAAGPGRPWLVWIWVDLQDPRPDGLSTDAEAPVLYEIEDALTEQLASALQAEPVGRITTARRREFYFYAPTAEGAEEAVAAALARHPAYTYDIGAREDPGWSHYREVLYPTPLEYQRMQNRRVLDALRDNGDDLVEPRPVRHWIYFRDPAAREQFIARVAPEHFSVPPGCLSEYPDTDRPFGVCIERRDHVDQRAIDAVVVRLLDHARATDGDYDGWETKVVAPGQVQP